MPLLSLGTARVPGLLQSSVPKSRAVTSREGALTAAAPAAMPPKQAANLLPCFLWSTGTPGREQASGHRGTKSTFML